MTSVWPLRVYEGEVDGLGVVHAGVFRLNVDCITTACNRMDCDHIFYEAPKTQLVTCLACTARELRDA